MHDPTEPGTPARAATAFQAEGAEHTVVVDGTGETEPVEGFQAEQSEHGPAAHPCVVPPQIP